MFGNITSLPYQLVFVFITSAILSGIFFYFNKGKQATIFIFFLAFLVYNIVKILVVKDIGIGTGIGLFAILSILSFRKTFSTKTLMYFFIAISTGILYGFSDNGFDILIILTLLMLFLLELFFLNNNNISFKLDFPIEDFGDDLSRKNIKSYMYKKYGNIKIRKILIKNNSVVIEGIK